MTDAPRCSRDMRRFNPLLSNFEKKILLFCDPEIWVPRNGTFFYYHKGATLKLRNTMYTINVVLEDEKKA